MYITYFSDHNAEPYCLAITCFDLILNYCKLIRDQASH